MRRAKDSESEVPGQHDSGCALRLMYRVMSADVVGWLECDGLGERMGSRKTGTARPSSAPAKVLRAKERRADAGSRISKEEKKRRGSRGGRGVILNISSCRQIGCLWAERKVLPCLQDLLCSLDTV